MNRLEEARATISRVDADMARLFEERMRAAEQVAAYKKENGLPVKDLVREEALIARNVALIGDPALKPYYADFLRKTIDLSCAYQETLLGEGERP